MNAWWKLTAAAVGMVLALGACSEDSDDDSDTPAPAASVVGTWTGTVMSAFAVRLDLSADSLFVLKVSAVQQPDTVLHYTDGSYSLNAAKDTVTLTPDSCYSVVTTCDTLSQKAVVSGNTLSTTFTAGTTVVPVALTRQ
jgi:hypothetical protein